jgi:hypothetical protein
MLPAVLQEAESIAAFAGRRAASVAAAAAVEHHEGRATLESEERAEYCREDIASSGNRSKAE